jgi:hypothetical protein
MRVALSEKKIKDANRDYIILKEQKHRILASQHAVAGSGKQLILKESPDDYLSAVSVLVFVASLMAAVNVPGDDQSTDLCICFCLLGFELVYESRLPEPGRTILQVKRRLFRSILHFTL